MNASQSHRALRVFLVEDAAAVRRRVALLLAGIAGVAIVGEAEDGDSALASILALNVDIAVVDLRLATGGGLGLITALRRARPAIVTIVLTNHSGPAFETACRSAGADFFYDKTAEFEAVYRTIAAMALAPSR